MRKVIAASTHTLLSLSNQEVATLALATHALLQQPGFTDATCPVQTGVTLPELRRLQRELAAVVASAGTDAFDHFEANREGFCLQLCAITALGTPADLSFITVLRHLHNLPDLPPAA